MPATLLSPVALGTVAGVAAGRNWAGNRAAVVRSQPAVAAELDGVAAEVEWTLGRDGSLTGRTADGRWWADCSVPDRAGRRLMAAVEPSAAVHCLVMPAHAGVLAAVRDRLGAGTPVVVVEPDARAARVLLGCGDVAGAVAGHRLWFAVGAGWADQLADLFRAWPGLATPSRFVRMPVADDAVVGPLIERAKAVFDAANGERTAAVDRLRVGSAGGPSAGPAAGLWSGRPVVIGRSGYTLWEDGPAVLWTACGSAATRFDTDDPLNTSPVALATAAVGCGGVVAADSGRGSAAGLVRPDVPWVTWVTRPAVPEVGASGPLDALVLAAAEWRPLAERAGWPGDRVHVGGWQAAMPLPCASGLPHLAVMADTRPVEMPPAVAGYSSHAMLWEAIEAELRSSPLAARDPVAYLADRAGQVRVDRTAVDVGAFVERLIYPAYQQGVARLLIAAGLPITLWGSGWGEVDEFAGRAGGSVESVAARDRAAGAAVGLVHCWPEDGPHPIDAVGRPVVRAESDDAARFVAAARRVVAGRTTGTVAASGESLRNAIARAVAGEPSGR